MRRLYTARSNTIEEGRMMKNNWLYFPICIIMLLTEVQHVCGQDQIPTVMHPDVRIANSRQLKEYKSTPDTIPVRLFLPEGFTHTITNSIEDKSGVLLPIMERLHRLKAGASEDTLRIVHIGDSHVRGRIFPRTVGLKLNDIFGSISYTDLGVNGATCLTFTHPDRIDAIVELKPELLILSFGTNESHNKRYNSTVHYHQMDELVKLLRSRMPDVPILLTTPPGSYESFRQSRRRRTYSINPRTVIAVNTIRKYAQNHKLAIWDMYTVLGGKDHACKNWWDSGLMRPDHIHYTADGYILQGELLFQALINAYNDYVTD